MGIFNISHEKLQINTSKQNGFDSNIGENNISESTINENRLTDDKIQKTIDLINIDNQMNEIPILENSPLVSIIIVNRNGEEHLKRLLDVIDDTIHLDYEIIIVDNHSTDNSLKVIDGYKKLPITLIKNDKNETFSFANNQGVDIAKGDYLLFLNNDTKPLDGWLNHLMCTVLSSEDIGAVGSKLIYPDCSTSELNGDKSYTIQHSGIIFEEGDGYVKPFNRDNAVNYENLTNKTEDEEIIAVTAACLLIKKSVYLEVGGFDNSYIYGYEDVDLCLKLHRAGYKNIYNPRSMLYHYEFGTQEKNDKKEVRDRRLNNQRIFINRWNKWLRKELLKDKINNNQLFTNRPLTVSFVVTQADNDTTAGDYFTALTLAKQLENFGWKIKYQVRRNKDGQKDWYDVDSDVDVLISLLDAYDLSQIRSDNGLLVKIAWLRNWFERWIEQPSFRKYDLVFASSQIACDFIKEKTGYDAILYPLASDDVMFNEEIPSVKEYICDYCFTGSYWDAKREIIDFLNPSSMKYSFNLYGVNWEKIPKLAPYAKGFVSYYDMPNVYSSCKIVVDDANHVTKEWGSVNSRVFDSLASGKLVITNGTKGNHELFNGLIPEYHSQKELTDVITYYMENERTRVKKINELRNIVLENHTYKHRADMLKSVLEKYYEKTKISIKIPVPSWNEIHKWGDYYLAEGLRKEFEKQGFAVKIQVLPEWDDFSDAIVDNVIVLRGLSFYNPKVQHYNIMWNISHPELVSLNEYELYDYVFVASEYWTNELKNYVDVPVDCMFQCTDTEKFYPEYNEEYESDLLFVGNSRKVFRKILKDLLPTDYNLSVYGADWDEFIDQKYIKGTYIPNQDLNKAYSSCKILLNDHWDDMRGSGFISNRIFDAIACGALVISDSVEGLEKLFPERVFTYESKEELDNLIKENLNNKKEIDNDMSGNTYMDRANHFIEIINKNNRE